MSRSLNVLAAAGAALLLAACGGGSPRAPQPPGNHTVTISWQANHEKGVNGPGGGYRVTIAGRPTIDLPYPSPTSITTVLYTGLYGVSVVAYQPLDQNGGLTGGASAASTLTVVVP